MPQSDVYAFEKSGLAPFLYAEVGTEMNGSALTIFSMLARLGQDPWAEAARWARMPRAAMVQALAESIALMPLPPQALREAHLTASRLALLLPSAAPVVDAASIHLPPMPGWLPMALVGGALVFGLAINMLTVGNQGAAVVAPSQQTVDPLAVKQ